MNSCVKKLFFSYESRKCIHATIILIIFSCSITFNSCSKSGDISQDILNSEYENLSFTNQKIKTILNSNDQQFQRQAFASLNDKERVSLLKYYLGLHLNEFKDNTSKATYLKKLINNIDENLMSDNGQGRFSILNYEAQNVFTREENIDIFYSFNIKSPHSQQKLDMPAPGDCHCFIEAVSLCNLAHDCNRSKNCKDTDLGCGFLFLKECNGLCWP